MSVDSGLQESQAPIQLVGLIRDTKRPDKTGSRQLPIGIS